MQETFLTIKEASNLSGRSEITIRRVIKYLISQKEILNNQTITRKYKVSKQMIDQLIKREKQNELPHSPFIYKISEDLIKQVFNLTTQNVNKTTIQKIQNDYSDDKEMPNQVIEHNEKDYEIITILKEQIKIKDEQIKSQNETIGQLIERDRETNILIAGLQKILNIEAPKKDA